MKALQKFGGVSALYMAAAYLIGMVLFLFVLNYPGITDPAQKVALLVEKQGGIFSTNLLMYVFFGVFLVVLSLALYDRLKCEAPALVQAATALGTSGLARWSPAAWSRTRGSRPACRCTPATRRRLR